MKKTIEWVLVLILAGSVLTFGGVQPLAYSLMEVSIFLSVLVLLVRRTLRGEPRFTVPWVMLPVILLTLLQIVPLPRSLVALLSPARVSFAGPLPPVAARPEWLTLSIYPHDTQVWLMKLLAYCGGFALAGFVFEPEERRSVLVRALIILGCFEALYGLFQYLTGFQRIFTYVKEFYTEEATGTYINRNHFAGFLELAIPFLVAEIFYRVQKGGLTEGSVLAQPRRSRPSALQPQIVFFAFLTLTVLIAAIYSRSRMGISPSARA